MQNQLEEGCERSTAISKHWGKETAKKWEGEGKEIHRRKRGEGSPTFGPFSRNFLPNQSIPLK
jgi:hypothetical protein